MVFLTRTLLSLSHVTFSLTGTSRVLLWVPLETESETKIWGTARVGEEPRWQAGARQEGSRASPGVGVLVVPAGTLRHAEELSPPTPRSPGHSPPVCHWLCLGAARASAGGRAEGPRAPPCKDPTPRPHALKGGQHGVGVAQCPPRSAGVTAPIVFLSISNWAWDIVDTQ